MADNQAADNDNSSAASVEASASASNSGGLVGAIFSGAMEAASSLWHALTDDGYLAAAARQGIDELGVALKPFPDSIQVDETGTLWNPTQGEIAAARDSSDVGPPHPWPSEIAAQNQAGNVHGNGYENGNDAGYSM
jgi:hypothetical protein